MAFTNNSVYWLGQDGNIYLKNGSTVQNAGKPLYGTASLNNNGFDSNMMSAEATYIDDPNPIANSDQSQANQQAAAESQRLAGVRNQVNTGVDNLQNSANQSLNNLYNSYNQQTRDFAQSYANSLQDINNQRVNTALNLRRSIADIADQLRQGQNSFGVQLGNLGAADSSAADVAAKAYARMGSKQFGQAQNQAALDNQGFDIQQQRLEQQRRNKIDDFNTYRQSTVDSISNDLLNQLKTLDANASAQGVSGAVNLGLRDQLINQAIARLAQVDQSYNNTLAGATPLTQDQINATAVQRDAAGASVNNPYNITFNPNAQFASTPGDTGYAPISQLPLYLTRSDQQQLGLV